VTFENGDTCSGTSETLINEAAMHAAIPARRNKIFFFMGEFRQSEAASDRMKCNHSPSQGNPSEIERKRVRGGMQGRHARV
jgi:hypothetical protein